MLPEDELRKMVQTLPSVTLYGPWSRAVRALHLRRSPGPPEPLWALGAPRNGARFTPKGGFPTIYLASDLPTAYAEVESVLAVRGFPASLMRHPPLVFLTVEGVLERTLDLTDDAIQTALGTTEQELTGVWLYDHAGRACPNTASWQGGLRERQFRGPHGSLVEEPHEPNSCRVSGPPRANGAEQTGGSRSGRFLFAAASLAAGSIGWE